MALHATSGASSLPLAIARGVKLLRTIELVTYTTENDWVKNILYYGVIAMKLYQVWVRTNNISAGLRSIPVGSLQSILVTLDDLLIGSALSRRTDSSSDQWMCNFTKGKIHSLRMELSSSAAPAERSGRMGLCFIWFNESEALEAVKDLVHKQTQYVPHLKRFFQMPGVRISPVSSQIAGDWTPPRGSWIQDFIRIGRSYGRGSGSAWGLPLGRVIVGYQTFDSDKINSYVSGASSLHLSISAVVDFAELGERVLEKQFTTELDWRRYGVYDESGNYVLDSEFSSDHEVVAADETPPPEPHLDALCNQLDGWELL